MRSRWFSLYLAPVILLISAAVSAKDARPAAFGTTATTMIQVPAAQCPAFGGAESSLATNEFIRAVTGPATFECFPNLPTGSKLVRIDVVAYDGSDSGAVNLNLVRCQSLDVNDLCAQSGLVATAGSSVSPFSGRLTADLSGDPIVVDKTSELDFVRVYLTEGTANLEFREVDFYYQLQVSTPAPGTQTFGDVPPSFLYYKGIEALAASGITGGCGNGNFCPNGYVTRGEIATFFARALGLNFPN